MTRNVATIRGLISAAGHATCCAATTRSVDAPRALIAALRGGLVQPQPATDPAAGIAP